MHITIHLGTHSPLDALFAFLVTSVIAVSIPKLCSKLAPVWLITADMLPNDLEMSVDDTLNEFDTSLQFYYGFP